MHPEADGKPRTFYFVSDVRCFNKSAINKMSRSRTNAVLAALLLCGAAIAQNGDVRPPVNNEDDRTCQPIAMGLCASVGYSNASFPNYRGHLNELEASAELEDFIALFQSGCSGAVVHFFCSFYFPFCASTSPDELVVLPPCRGFCQHVRDRCEPVFSRYQGVSWPEFLNCSAFPEIAENGPCFTPPDPSEVTVPPIVFSFDVILPTLVVEPPTTPQATPTAVATTTQTLTPTPPPACQRVDTKYCPSAIGYTDTRFPTSRGQQTQLQAETELASYETLIRTECSGAIVHFLCSYFFPECVNGVVLEPCRELCLHVRPGCRAAVQQLNSTWPAEFACESLPSRTGGSCSGPANPAAVSVPVIPGVTDRGDATVPLTLTTLLLVCLAAVYCGGF